jgi:hypothetical protein
MKAGDLAIQIYSTAGNEGKIVTLISYEGVLSYPFGIIADSWKVDYGRPALGRTADGYVVVTEAIKTVPIAWFKLLPPNEKEIEEELEHEFSNSN